MTLLTIGYVLSGLVGVGIIFIGARFLWVPQVAANGYGLSESSPGGYLSAKGVRDIFSGILVFILIASGTPHILGWVMLVATIIP